MTLKADGITIIEMDALKWLRSCQQNSVDIAFVDPPFGSGLETLSLELLSQWECVNTGGLLYVETARNSPPVNPGDAWDTVKEKVLGEVRMVLLKKI